MLMLRTSWEISEKLAPTAGVIYLRTQGKKKESSYHIGYCVYVAIA